ncbi:kinase-like domain-containing protein [Cercophora samala]|uniref:Kinase-like domain-containing protein n=1 Tax=Cercophora samala TaxID=330535 RepID=A0AA40DDV2_9PEZI|nr:kinase-like domain-containing protein [Cercophora samala]
MNVHHAALRLVATFGFIGQESVIGNTIYKDGLRDEKLPFMRPTDTAKQTSEMLPSFNSLDATIVDAFLDKQWYFLAPVIPKRGNIGFGMDLKLDARCPLPIQKNVLIVQENDIRVHQAWLHPSHVHGLFFVKPSVAIKEIPYTELYEWESARTRHSHALNHKHIIGLLASCERGDLNCLIFPWAEGGDLVEYWKRRDSLERHTSDFTVWLLEQLLGLADAIKCLHNAGASHGDLRPQNILHFTNFMNLQNGGLGTLVLANIGVSSLYDHEIPEPAHRASIQYKAPEVGNGDEVDWEKSQSWDMWSMGCIIFEFMVWLFSGLDRVKLLSSRRGVSELYGNPEAPGSFFWRNPQGSVEIHPTIHDEFTNLRAIPSCRENTALMDLLDLAQNDLLRVDPKDRADAHVFHANLQRIVTAMQGGPENLHTRVQDAPPESPGLHDEEDWLVEALHSPGSRHGSSPIDIPTKPTQLNRGS